MVKPLAPLPPNNTPSVLFIPSVIRDLISTSGDQDTANSRPSSRARTFIIYTGVAWKNKHPSLALRGLTHGITIVRGQGRQGVYAEDRSIRVLGVDMLSEYLLPRRDEYTRVYTTVYPRVHNCIHACTLPRSKYILCRARLYVYSLGIMPRISSDGLRLSGI